MKPASRAYRLIQHIQASLHSLPEHTPNASHTGLGAPAGCLKGPGSDGRLIAVYMHGLRWFEAGEPFELQFNAIQDARFPQGRYSTFAEIETTEGQECIVPLSAGQCTLYLLNGHVLRM